MDLVHFKLVAVEAARLMAEARTADAPVAMRIVQNAMLRLNVAWRQYARTAVLVTHEDFDNYTSAGRDRETLLSQLDALMRGQEEE